MAVRRINADTALLPGIELELVHVDIVGVRMAERLDLKQCLLQAHLDERLANVSAIVGLGYSADLRAISPLASSRGLPVVSYGAASNEFSNKTEHPFVARMSRPLRGESYSMFEVLEKVIPKEQNTKIKLVSCDDEYCRDCAKDIRTIAKETGLSVVHDIELPALSFKNDPNGRTLIYDLLSDCTISRVAVMCTQVEQAAEVWKIAEHLDLVEGNVWITPLHVTTTQVPEYRKHIPMGALGLRQAKRDEAALAEAARFAEFWKGVSAGFDVEEITAPDADPYILWAVDAGIRQRVKGLGFRVPV